MLTSETKSSPAVSEYDGEHSTSFVNVIVAMDLLRPHNLKLKRTKEFKKIIRDMGRNPMKRTLYHLAAPLHSCIKNQPP